MSTAVQVGKEATHGTVASSFVSVPCAFKPTLKQVNRIWDEDRNGQDRNYAASLGVSSEEFTVGDSAVYHDTIGLWLASAVGAPTKIAHAGETTVFDNTFKFADDPTSLSLKWQQPRRYTQAYESLYGVVDKMGFKFSADGDLTYTCSGVAMSETEVATLTYSFSTAKPFSNWSAVAKIGGSTTADLVSGAVNISRNRKPFHTINNTQSPSKMSIGSRMVDFEFILDFVTKANYDDFKNLTTTSFQVTFTDASVDLGVVPSHPVFDISMGTTVYETGEVDTDPDLPLVKVAGKALYDTSDASLAVFLVTSTTDYTA